MKTIKINHFAIFLWYILAFLCHEKSSYGGSTRQRHALPPRGDGTALEVRRLSEVDDETWNELTAFVAYLGSTGEVSSDF